VTAAVEIHFLATTVKRSQPKRCQQQHSLKLAVVVTGLLCSAGANPFDEDDEEEEDFSDVVGRRVEALYDYVGQEDDELSFKKGIRVQKLAVFLCLP